MDGKKLIGYVGVDSGQIIICDPCYIASEWDNGDDFKDIRRYKRKGSKKIYQYEKDFKSYEQILFNKKSVNELIEKKQLIAIPNKPSNKFSYGGACSQTITKEGGGQLNYKKGHAGAGVAVSSGYGDGHYPVYAEYVDEGMGKRIAKITIDFMGTYTQKAMKKFVKKS